MVASLPSGHHSGWPILFLARAGRMVAASMWNPLARGAPGSYTRYHLEDGGAGALPELPASNTLLSTSFPFYISSWEVAALLFK